MASLIIRELTHSDWPSTEAMLLCWPISSSFSSSLFDKDKAILHCAHTMGWTFLSILMWYSKSLNLPMPEKHPGYIYFNQALLLIGGLWYRSMSWWVYLLQLLAFSSVLMVWMLVYTTSVTPYISGSSHSEKESNL